LVIAEVLIINDLKRIEIWIEIIEIAQKIDINSDKNERLSIAPDTRKRQSTNDILSIISTEAWRGIDVTSLKMWKLRFRTFAGNFGH
jgi:hypothetical protein